MYSIQSMEMQECRQHCKQNRNNKGFSLLEVLVAIIILSIVSIPIIRSFATVAKTNAESKILLRATDGAENVMENIKYQTLDDLVARYSISGDNTVTVDANGKYEMVIKAASDIPVTLPDGYYVTITADPGLYPNANALNIADVKSMSITDTAVYEMAPLYDAGIYEKFDRWNLEAHNDQDWLYQRMNNKYFKQNLSRTIEITIDKKGTALSEAGDTVDLVAVNLDIRYFFRNQSQYKHCLPESQKEYVESTRELYNNLTTKVPLSGVFILYQPRYLATANGNRDNIIINNPDNIEVNVMVAAQNGAEDASYMSQYFNTTTGPNVTIIENPTGAIADADGAVTLLTNLSSDVPYSALPDPSGVVEDGKILCNLTYQNPAGTAKVTGLAAVKVLDGRDLDGKALVAQNTKNRIYKIKVDIRDASGNSIVELDGTKLE